MQYRFDDLFRLVVNPLREGRCLDVELEVSRLPENDRFPQRFVSEEVDVVLVEGIFLLTRELIARYDLRFWIECSFDEALARALQRDQEGLSAAETIEDYRRIYFAAQRVHFTEDAPMAHCDGILVNEDTGNARS